MPRSLSALLSALFLVLPSRQRRLIFRPDTTDPDASFAGLPGSFVSIRTVDGLDLRCWWTPPPTSDAPVILYLHGNGGHLGHRAPRIPTFRDAGCGAFLLGYRGYGDNPGHPTERGLSRDADAALAFLSACGISPHRLLVWGESLGSAVATRLAVSAPPAVLVLETPFTSMTAIGRAMVPFLPVELLLRDRFDSLSRIPRLRCPLLVAAGERDTLTPPAMARTLFDAAPPPKRFLLQPGAGHGELPAAAILAAATGLLP
ncbi:MAG: alpha/beta hydrolase [Gluconacetobacter diazotrophicus]|nr:alpha/beta hydrolase [Gluconacetobacter diazotrophicus]